ncbi:MAG TPA: DUF58 domain-containing protein [Burkholderiaceae bacterium]|nr:DUF58 domain-containing protein [Burkholderiaceae bacterium]
MSVTTHPWSIRIGAWIAGRDAREAGDVLLDRKRVYILPTRAGALFGAAMFVLLLGSINYGLQLGFLLTFVVASMAAVGMYHTHRNLARITVRGASAEPVFAGDVISFEIALANPTPEARYALNFSFVLPTRRRRGGLFRSEPPAPGPWVDVAAKSAQSVRLALPTRRRGRRACPRVRIRTVFPFGLWQAWAYLRPALDAIVYPKPEEDAPPLPMALGSGERGLGMATSGEDFAGVRPYQRGDPQKMIAWKLAARSDDLSVKLFDAEAGGELVLDYLALPATLDVEMRLARLARWVLDAEAAHMRYGLRLPAETVAPGSGPEHRARCLTALALFPG